MAAQFFPEIGINSRKTWHEKLLSSSESVEKAREYMGKKWKVKKISKLQELIEDQKGLRDLASQKSRSGVHRSKNYPIKSI